MTQSILLLTTLPVFAAAVMAALLNPQPTVFTRRKVFQLTILFAATLLLNIAAFCCLGIVLYRKCYFLLIQLPLFIGFWMITEYRGIKLLFTLLTTVVLCSLPVELVVLARILSHGEPLAMTAGLLLSYCLVIVFIFRFLRPGYLFTLKYGEPKLFWKFSLIPLLYYLYTYLLTGYNFTQVQSLKHYFINLIPVLMILVFYLLIPDVFQTTCEKQFLENRRNLMMMQLSSATEQIEQLRTVQRQSDIYRHDLRHHMNYLSSCLAENEIPEAAAYIEQISEEIDHVKVIRYCSNEAVNLILTSYASKATTRGIEIEIQVSGIDFSRFQIMDICSLLSNSLENALKACEPLETSRFIRLRMFEKNSRLCLKITNSFKEAPLFENDIPVSHREGHGIGVKSMVYVIEKYHGIYKFSVENEMFVFEMMM